MFTKKKLNNKTKVLAIITINLNKLSIIKDFKRLAIDLNIIRVIVLK